MNRETWLEQAVEALLVGVFARELPGLRVSVGWPSRGALRTTKRVIGECWRPESSADGKSQIFISPLLTDPLEVLSVLVHEMCHAFTPGAKHGGDFITLAREVGLVKPWTATTAGPDLAGQLTTLVQTLGEYPHAALTPGMSPVKKQATYMRKAMCPECGYTVRGTKKWFDLGLPTCPCGEKMEES